MYIQIYLNIYAPTSRLRICVRIHIYDYDLRFINSNTPWQTKLTNQGKQIQRSKLNLQMQIQEHWSVNFVTNGDWCMRAQLNHSWITAPGQIPCLIKGREMISTSWVVIPNSKARRSFRRGANSHLNPVQESQRLLPYTNVMRRIGRVLAI